METTGTVLNPKRKIPGPRLFIPQNWGYFLGNNKDCSTLGSILRSSPIYGHYLRGILGLTAWVPGNEFRVDTGFQSCG